MATLKSNIFRISIVIITLLAFLCPFLFTAGKANATSFYMGSPVQNYGTVFPGDPMYCGTWITFIETQNPSTFNGTLNSFGIYAPTEVDDVCIGVFYNSGSNSFTCRGYQRVGNITAGYQQIYGLSITTQVGDYIGMAFDCGNVSVAMGGYAGASMYFLLGSNGCTAGSATYSGPGPGIPLALQAIGYCNTYIGGTYEYIVNASSDTSGLCYSTPIPIPCDFWCMSGLLSSVWAHPNGFAQTCLNGIGILFGIGVNPSNASAYRSYVQFNTSAISSGSTVVDAYVDIFWLERAGGGDAYGDYEYVVVTNGSPIYPHTPLESGDFNKNHYSGIGGAFNVSSLPINGYGTVLQWGRIYFDDDAIGWVQNSSGIVKFCIESFYDYNWNSVEPPYTVIPSYDSIWLYNGLEMYGYHNGSDWLFPPGISGYFVPQLHVFVKYIDPPSDLAASATSSSQVYLTWTPNVNVSGTIIRRSASAYPANVSSGDLVYKGNASLCYDNGLNGVTKYYYRAWAYNGTSTDYSIGYSDAYATTWSTGVHTNSSFNIIDVNVSNNEWYGNLSCIANIPLQSLFTDAAAKIGCSPCVLVVATIVALTMAVSVGIFMFTGSLAFSGLAGLIVLIGGYWTGGLPLYIMFVYALLGISVYYVLRRA